MSSSAEAVIERRAGEIAWVQPGDVRAPRLDGDRGSVRGRAGEVGGGERQQVGVPVVQRPSAADPGSSGASQRPIAPVPQPRSWITQRPARRERLPELLDEVACAGRGVGRLAQGKPVAC